MDVRHACKVPRTKPDNVEKQQQEKNRATARKLNRLV